MTSILRISEAASLALHTTAFLACEPEEVATTGEVAQALGVSEAHLAKVLQRLAKAGLVKSTRGPKGGHSLARRPDSITLLEVYEAIEGPLQTSDCLLARSVCGHNCIMGDLLGKVNALVKEQMSGTKLSQATKLIGGGKHA